MIAAPTEADRYTDTMGRLARKTPAKAANRLAWLDKTINRVEHHGACPPGGDTLESLKAKADALTAALAATVRCWRCGIQLTDPDSKEAGIGPICQKKVMDLFGVALGRRLIETRKPHTPIPNPVRTATHTR